MINPDTKAVILRPEGKKHDIPAKVPGSLPDRCDTDVTQKWWTYHHSQIAFAASIRFRIKNDFIAGPSGVIAPPGNVIRILKFLIYLRIKITTTFMKSLNKYFNKWSVAIKVLPLTLIVIIFKFIAHKFGFEIMDLNALFSSLIAGTIF